MSHSDSPAVFVPTEIQSPGAPQVVYYTRHKPRYWVHVVLLVLTFFTTLVVGARMEWNFLRGLPPFFMEGGGFPFPLFWALQERHLLLGIPFSLTLMSILLAHEMGHYLYCLSYGVRATLPFFIPFPTLIGTLGAFIRIRSPLRSRSVLFDIGIAGPIAGFAVALPVLLFSLGLSRPAPIDAPSPDIQFGFPLVFYLVQKVLAASHASISAIPLTKLYLHPVAIAAWVGMFATSLNLLPGGQLDGGHIIYSVSPRAHKQISRATILALIPMAVYFWIGWFIWAVLLRLSAMRHPAVPEWPEVSPRRRWLAVVAVLILALTLTPAPFQRSSIFDVLQQWRSSQ